jgi:hypothetical protein
MNLRESTENVGRVGHEAIGASYLASWPTRPTFSVLSRRFMRASSVDSSGMI